VKRIHDHSPIIDVFFVQIFFFFIFLFSIKRRKKVDGKQEKREKVIDCQDFNGKKNNNLGINEILSTREV
jgi:biopolymer transport protein ExbD